MHSSVIKIVYTCLHVLCRWIHLGTRALEAILLQFQCLKLGLLELRWFYLSTRIWVSVFRHTHSTLHYCACICEWRSQAWDSIPSILWWTRSFRNVIYIKGNTYGRWWKILKREIFLNFFSFFGCRSLCKMVSELETIFLYSRHPDISVSSFKQHARQSMH